MRDNTRFPCGFPGGLLQRGRRMKNPTPYLKMRVLGAIDMAEGHCIQARIKRVAQMTFTDEEGHARQFTWRTIQTWLTRYKKHGVTALENTTRSDKGAPRKAKPEELLEAIRAVLPKTHGKTPTCALLYRLCIEQGVLTRTQIAPNTFSRLVNQFELLKADRDCEGRHRLAFAKAHANELWQADTLYGPHVTHAGAKASTRLIAFLDDASRVCCHGEFFVQENVDTLIAAFRAALYKRGVPESLYVDNGSIYASKELIQVCARVGCLLHHTPVRMEPRRERSSAAARHGRAALEPGARAIRCASRVLDTACCGSANHSPRDGVRDRKARRGGLARHASGATTADVSSEDGSAVNSSSPSCTRATPITARLTMPSRSRFE